MPVPTSGLATDGSFAGQKTRERLADLLFGSTQDVLARYIAALGGTLRLVADFGDEQLNVA